MDDARADVDVVVDPKNYAEGLTEVVRVLRPGWTEVQFKLLHQGYSNHTILCYVDHQKDTRDWIVARVFGTETGITFKRDVERRVTELFSEIGVSPKIYGYFKNGICFEFAEGDTCTWADVSTFKDEKLGRAVARALAKVHCQTTRTLALEKYHIEDAKCADEYVMELINTWPDIIGDEETTQWYNSQVPSPEERRQEATMLLALWEETGLERTLTHGDCNPTNIIYNKEKDKAILVDLEGSGMNTPILDLVAFLAGSAFGITPDPTGLEHSPDYIRDFLKTYLMERQRLDGEGEEVEEKTVEKYYILTERMGIGFHYLMHMIGAKIATMQARQGGDTRLFLNIGISRLHYYQKHRDRMLALKVPE